jgi:hypothetical protein
LSFMLNVEPQRNIKKVRKLSLYASNTERADCERSVFLFVERFSSSSKVVFIVGIHLNKNSKAGVYFSAVLPSFISKFENISLKICRLASVVVLVFKNVGFALYASS